MSGNSFINPLRGDRLDNEFATDEELATAIATRVATQTYNSGVSALNTTINNKAEQSAVNASLALKQGLAPENDSYALTNSVNASLDTKQGNPPENDSFVLTTVMNAGMANKQDLAPEGDSYALTNSVDSSLQNKQDLAPEGDSFVLTSVMSSDMATKQDNPPEDDSFVLTTTMDTSMATKQDLAPTGDSYALTNSVNASLDTKQGNPPENDSFVLTTVMNTAMAEKQDTPTDPDDSFVLNSNMNAALNNKVDKPGNNDSFVLNSDLIGELNDKQNKPNTDADPDNRFVARNEVYLTNEIYTKVESDDNYLGSVSIGSVNTLPAYDINSGLPNQASVVNTGTGNNVILDFQIPQGFTGAVGASGGSGGTGATGERGERGERGETGSAGIVSAVALAAAVASGITSFNLPTATDFTDMGSDIATLTDDKVSKPSDWSIQSQYPETELNPYTLDDYVYEKVRFNNKLDKATVLDIGKSGDSTHVNFNAKHTKINSDDVNIGASVVPAGYKLIVEGDTKIQNGTNKYLDVANNKVGIRTDADIIDLNCDIKLVGDTCIEGDLKVSGVLKNGNDKPYILQEDHDADITTLTDIMTDFQDAIQTNSDGTNTIPDGQKLAYQSELTPLQTTIDTFETSKADTSAIPDVSNFITSADLPDVSNFITSSDLPDTSGFALSSAIPDISSFITNSTNSLANYDTSSVIDGKISSAGVGGYWTKDASNKLSYTTGLVGLGMNNPASILQMNPNTPNQESPETTGCYVYNTNTGDASLTLRVSGSNAGDPYISFDVAGEAGWALGMDNSDGNKFKLNYGWSTLDGNTKLTATPDGNIGINTSSPLAKLHVNGSKSSYLNRSTVGVYAWWYTAGLARTTLGNQNYNLSIYATNEIATNRMFFSTQGAWSASDARIKRDIEDINDSEALTQLRQLQPKKYGYKDVGERGTGKVIGFIADEVEEVIPEAVTKTEWGIPSILEVSNVIGSNVISFTNFSTSNLDSNATALECLDVFGEEHFITIAKVIDEKTIQVEEDLSNWTGSFDETGNLVVNTTTAKLTLEEYDALEPDEQNGYVDEGDVYVKTITSYPGNNLFIRGERVNDFRTLKKEMLFAINFSATQELDRQLQAEKTKVASLEARLSALEEKI